MTGLLFVLSKSTIRHLLPSLKQKYFTVAYRNKYVFINCASLITLTINIEN